MKKVAFYTLGCKLNFSETSSIGRLFTDANYQIVDFTEGADVYVINTCSVTDHADKKCKKVVKEALKYSPNAYVTIVGCYAQLKPKEISEIEGVDMVLGAAEKFRIVEFITDLTKESKAKIHQQDISQVGHNFVAAYSIGDRTRTFLKVQDGCDYPCTYCTIPLARGGSRSDTIANVVARAREIGKSGVKEIVLTGVNLGDFGIRDGVRSDRFIDLVKELESVEEIDRFRISSIEPNLLSNEVIDFVASSKKFVPHFHIPLQSGSDKILGLMKRRYQRDLYKERVERIKSIMPNCCIGVDVIVGFPGESQEDFLDTYEFLNTLDISYLHVFTFSEREDTPAVTMKNKVAGSTAFERNKMLHILSEKKRRAFYEAQIGKEAEVLFEDDLKNGYMHGFTRNYVKVKAKYDPVMVNELKTIQMVGLSPEGEMEVIEISTPIHAH